MPSHGALLSQRKDLVHRVAVIKAATDRIRGDQTVLKSVRDQKVMAYAPEFAEVQASLKHVDAQLATHAQSLGLMGGFDGQLPTGSATRAIVGKSAKPASPSDLEPDVWREAFDAATRRKSFRAHVDVKAPTTIGLPAVIQPGLTQTLPYEPDRLFDHLPVIAVDVPTVEYISHVGNTNPAAVVAELGTKPDLGMQLATKTATMTKIAALASASMEALQDFQTFQAFIPAELQRAVIDAETAFVAAQLLATAGVLTRAKASGEAPLDTLLESFNDLRTGAAFVEPNLIALHPTTWTWLRTQKDTQGRYMLNPDPTSDQRPNIWGVDVITNTRITLGDALVLNTGCVQGWTRMGLTIDSDGGYAGQNFATNAVSFRAEERIAIGALKPAGINIVTGLAASS